MEKKSMIIIAAIVAIALIAAAAVLLPGVGAETAPCVGRAAVAERLQGQIEVIGGHIFQNLVHILQQLLLRE